MSLMRKGASVILERALCPAKVRGATATGRSQTDPDLVDDSAEESHHDRGQHVQTDEPDAEGSRREEASPFIGTTSVGGAHQSPWIGPTKKNATKPMVLLNPCARIDAHSVS